MLAVMQASREFLLYLFAIMATIQTYMKKSLIFAALLAALALAVSCKDDGIRSFSADVDPLCTQVYTLDNGMQIFMSVNKETPRIQTFMAVRVGSKNDPSETTGLAHYFEHLMFKGTESFGTSDYEAEKPMLDEIEAMFEQYRVTTDEAERAAIYHRIDSVSYEASKIAIPNEYDKLMAVIGADGTNAWTSSDETVYTEDIPSNQIDNWARIQADRFRHGVIRGFHTELETIYEEKNMSLTQDMRKVWEALDQGLFPNHPYGQQTTLGSQEHLKNPSITNVKKYHDQYYVPNNIAVCVSGDFEPAEMVAAIEKYFGDWEPNPEIPVLQFEPEQPITEPVVKEVKGLEAENMAMAWRLPAAAELQESAVADIAGYILCNGQAGLIDLDVNQQQKALSMYSGTQLQPDYGSFLIMARPKEGQSLEQLRDIALEEVAKLAAGDFDEGLVQASINNIKLNKMRQLESNRARANIYVDAFINGIPWEDACREMERYEAVTKEDIVAWAQQYLGADNYVIVYKRQGVDDSIQKISAPAITPIESNRDKQSAFLAEIQATEVTPIEPVWVDFSKDMSQCDLADGVDMLYKRNELNDVYQLNFVFNYGLLDNPVLSTAVDYLPYLGTADKTAEQIASEMFALACDWRISTSANRTVISMSGLGENMAAAAAIVEDLILNAVADEDVLAGVKADALKSRANAKKAQRSCASALQRYVIFGPEYVSATTPSNAALSAYTSEQLLEAVREMYAKGHEVVYYGPAAQDDVVEALAACHPLGEGRTALPERNTRSLAVDSPSVVLAQYDAPQLYYYQYSDRGEKYDTASEAGINLYNEHFGGGMNAIVFQEMREARGLAYSAWARLAKPTFADDDYYYMAFIATQNDKLQIATEAFDEIINNMPESEAAFSVAKESLISRMRTDRTVGTAVLSAFSRCRTLGLEEPLDREVFAALQDMTLEDVKSVQQKWVKDRAYVYAILGDIPALDTRYLSTLGPVKVVSSEDIFGY